MPTEQSSPGAARAIGAVFQHSEGFIRRELPTAQRHHADARGNVVVEHHERILLEMRDVPVAHGAYACHLIGNSHLLQRDVRVIS